MEQERTAPDKDVRPFCGKGLRGLYFGAQITEKVFFLLSFLPSVSF